MEVGRERWRKGGKREGRVNCPFIGESYEDLRVSNRLQFLVLVPQFFLWVECIILRL